MLEKAQTATPREVLAEFVNLSRVVLGIGLFCVLPFVALIWASGQISRNQTNVLWLHSGIALGLHEARALGHGSMGGRKNPAAEIALALGICANG